MKGRSFLKNTIAAVAAVSCPFSLIFPALLLILNISCSRENQEIFESEIVIYGGTSSAVIAAVESVQNGMEVIIISPDVHLGGLTSGGLGWTDSGKKETIGGLSRNFYHRVWKEYNKDEAWVWQKREEYGNRGQGTPSIDGENRTMWIFEPHVAEKIFEDYISEYDIRVFRDTWLDRESGVIMDGDRVKAIKSLDGKTFKAKMFIDATYEGDLMAAAGVSYHVGRESSDTYGEEWNGVQKDARHHGHFFPDSIDPYVVPGDPSGGLVARISEEYPGENGEGDMKVQAYCFRVCMSKHPENRIPFPRPDDYDSTQYELLLRVFDTGWRGWFYKFDPIPNKKTDTNNNGPFSSDNIGLNYDYPQASYEEREIIVREHENYQKGLLWFVSNDPRVPVEIREKMADWGLPRDEFTDNGGWPHQLYIREARRMIGEYVTTEHDVLLKRKAPKPVGMGSYTMDSHNVQRYVTKEGFVQNEGDIGVKPPGPYSISYLSLVPKKEECSNLLVPVCLSSSHIAFGSIRMEPVFMILGQSAAAAAAIAIQDDVSVQEVSYDKLSRHLSKKGQILSYEQ